MTQWRCTVKTPSNYLQTVYVEAYTRQDAVAAAEHSTGGCCIMANVENVGTDSDHYEDHSSSGGGDIDGAGLLGLFLIVFMIAAWKYLLIFGAIGLVTWLIIKYSQE